MRIFTVIEENICGAVEEKIPTKIYDMVETAQSSIEEELDAFMSTIFFSVDYRD